MTDTTLPSERVSRLFVYLGLVGLSFVTLISFLGANYWIFELLSHFRVQYAAVATCMLVLLLISQAQRLEWIVGLILLGVNAVPILIQLGASVTTPAVAVETPDARAMWVNLQGENVDLGAFYDYVGAESPDVIALTEVGANRQAILDDLARDYPYTVQSQLNNVFEIVLLSRHPIVSERISGLDFARPSAPTLAQPVFQPDVPVISAEICPFESACYTVLAAHAPPPVSARMADMRNTLLDLVAQLSRQRADNRLIVMGDLNTSVWSPQFAALLEDGQMDTWSADVLVDSTWLSKSPFLGLTIDHVLHREGISLGARRVGPDIGSDHYPLLADLVLR